MKPLISSEFAKITSARSPIIPAPTSAGAPFCGPSSLTSVLNRKFRSQKSRIFVTFVPRPPSSPEEHVLHQRNDRERQDQDDQQPNETHGPHHSAVHHHVVHHGKPPGQCCWNDGARRGKRAAFATA